MLEKRRKLQLNTLSRAHIPASRRGGSSVEIKQLYETAAFAKVVDHSSQAFFHVRMKNFSRSHVSTIQMVSIATVF